LVSQHTDMVTKQNEMVATQNDLASKQKGLVAKDKELVAKDKELATKQALDRQERAEGVAVEQKESASFKAVLSERIADLEAAMVYQDERVSKLDKLQHQEWDADKVAVANGDRRTSENELRADSLEDQLSSLQAAVAEGNRSALTMIKAQFKKQRDEARNARNVLATQLNDLILQNQSIHKLEAHLAMQQKERNDHRQITEHLEQRQKELDADQAKQVTAFEQLVRVEKHHGNKLHELNGAVVDLRKETREGFQTVEAERDSESEKAHENMELAQQFVLRQREATEAERKAKDEAQRLREEKAASERREAVEAERKAKDEAQRLREEKAAKDESQRLREEKAAKDEAQRLREEKAASDKKEALETERARQKVIERLDVERIELANKEELDDEKTRKEAERAERQETEALAGIARREAERIASEEIEARAEQTRKEAERIHAQKLEDEAQRKERHISRHAKARIRTLEAEIGRLTHHRR